MAGAARALLAGGIVVYPTETSYAIGCLAHEAAAIAAICRIKGRPPHKPLPMLAASAAQADFAADLSAAPARLLRAFWPGPLTLLLPARPGLPGPLRNGENLAAIRVSSCPLAAALAASGPFPLVSTSANLSGQSPAQSPADLSPAFLSACLAEALPFCVLSGGRLKPCPPSTIVRPEGGERLRILRNGIITKETLQKEGFLTLESSVSREA